MSTVERLKGLKAHSTSPFPTVPPS